MSGDHDLGDDDLLVSVGAIARLAAVLPISATPSQFARVLAVAAREFTAVSRCDDCGEGVASADRADGPAPPPAWSFPGFEVPAPPRSPIPNDLPVVRVYGDGIVPYDAPELIVCPARAPAVVAGRSGLDWTPDEDAALRRLHAEGVPVRDVAIRLDRPREATRKRIDILTRAAAPGDAARPERRQRKDALTPADLQRVRDLRAQGESFARIGAAIGRGAEAVRKAFRRDVPAAQDQVKVTPPIRPDTWTAIADDILATRWTEGAAIEDIAAELGRTVKACQVRLTRLREDGNFEQLRQRRAAVRPAPSPAPAPAAPAATPSEPASDPVEKTGMAVAAEKVSAPEPEPAPEPAPAKGEPNLPLTAVMLAMRKTDAPPVPALTGLKREVWLHLAGLNTDEFTTADDLYLAESLVGRVPMEVICDELGCDSKAALARFAAMKFPAILVDRSKTLSIAGQAALLDVLRLRAAAGEVAK